MYQSFHFRLIYVFTINDTKHRGCVKVGETSLGEDVDNPFGLLPSCKELNKAAKARIDQYTKTLGVDDDVQLLYTELTASLSKGKISQFNDKQVHDILERSGIKKKKIGSATEWFECGVAEVKEAIKAAKDGRSSIGLISIAKQQQPIIFRPEQLKAIKDTKSRFATNNQYLWNAKMRFGKTLTALQVVKELTFEKTIIITHRPVVDKGWFEDFGKIFFDSPNYRYGSRNKGEDFQSLLHLNKTQGTHFVYFASIQDLRGSDVVGGNFDKNSEIFSTQWDLLIVDEAHEGTKTPLGQAVIHEIFKGNTKMLQLSGTPFNLFEDYKEDEIYTWDYVMEQRAKQDWEKTHWAEHNPYAALPKLNIYTFDLSLELKKYQDNEHAFNFAEFFRVNEDGKFKHEQDVDMFLNLLASNDAKNYPYSKLEWRQNLRHSLWTVPSVAAAAALSIKLRNHPVLGQFRIVNVAGQGDTDADYESDNALEMVQEAIGTNPEETMTITLSRGRLTTGVTVPAWTAVFMLHGSFSTSAASYMQTIFRAQSPATINGKLKEECFVFDFAPDRTLKVLAETAKVSAKAGKTKSDDKVILGEFLNFCPVISFHGAQMSPISVDNMMQQLKRVYVDRVVRNGFEDVYLYNDRLLQLNQVELEKFANLRGIIGQTKAMKRPDEVDVNKQGFTNEEYEEIERLKKKPKQQLTLEDLEKLKQIEEKKKQRNTAISILRGISIRMPMLLYGADITDEKTEITLHNFTEIIDDQSWEEFMPKGVTKELFKEFIPYYDEDIFAASGVRIRCLAREADEMDIEERIERITTIFTSFRNPDKETVLTPWRVVNMQLADTVGGWCFYDNDYQDRLMTPRRVDNGEVTHKVFGERSQILEINSKSGLYPLYVAYSIYREIIDKEQMSYMITDTAVADRIEHHRKVWDKVLRENIFVICKTPMAKSITIRTLAGFREGVKVNARYFEDLINQISNKKEKFVKQITSYSYWNRKTYQDMKFTAIVGNPPYQINVAAGASDDGSVPIYNRFIDIAKSIMPNYISMIMPSKWMIGGRGLQQFRKDMIEDTRIEKLFDYENDREIFPNTHIDGGLCYILWNKDYSGKVKYAYKPTNGGQLVYHRDLKKETSSFIVRDFRRQVIIKKVTLKGVFSKIVSSINPFNINSKLFNNPNLFPDANFSEESFDGAIGVWGVKGIKGGAKRYFAYIEKSFIKKNVNWLNQYCIYFSKTYSTGAIEYPEIILAEPGIVCTETFLAIGPFNTKQQMQNCAKYMSTNFFKVLLFFGKGTIHVTQDVFCYVPLQDFTPQSDIDWSKTVPEIDQQLYAKYNLSADEINFIESMIKPMA